MIEMIDMSHAFIAYGYVAEVISKNGSYYGFITNSDPPYRTVFFHENERGAYTMGDYQMPVITPLPNKFSGPTVRQKNPEVGDPAAYYLGVSERGPFARRWCIISSKKQSFSAAHRLAATKG